MVTEVLIEYLKDENVDIKKKKAYIEVLNLSYSELFELKEMFSYDNKLYQVLHGFIYYKDSNFKGKINYQNRKIKNRQKQRKMRQGEIRNDKHKRK